MWNCKTHITKEMPKANLTKVLWGNINVYASIWIRILDVNEVTKERNGKASNTFPQGDLRTHSGGAYSY
jgi:hypothetical protein